MEQDGKYFRAFVEERKMNKLKLAADMGMSQPNLYGLFKSKKFEPETIEKIETTLNVKWQDVLNTNLSTNISRETKESILNEDYRDKYIALLEKLLEGNETLVKTLDQRFAEIQANLRSLAAYAQSGSRTKSFSQVRASEKMSGGTSQSVDRPPHKSEKKGK